MSDTVEHTPPDPGTETTEECLPCRGTGRVVSQLGGSSSPVPCPWCEGSGLRRRGIDAQAAWPSHGEPAEADTPAPDSAEPHAETA